MVCADRERNQRRLSRTHRSSCETRLRSRRRDPPEGKKKSQRASPSDRPKGDVGETTSRPSETASRWIAVAAVAVAAVAAFKSGREGRVRRVQEEEGQRGSEKDWIPTSTNEKRKTNRKRGKTQGSEKTKATTTTCRDVGRNFWKACETSSRWTRDARVDAMLPRRDTRAREGDARYETRRKGSSGDSGEFSGKGGFVPSPRSRRGSWSRRGFRTCARRARARAGARRRGRWSLRWTCSSGGCGGEGVEC